MNRIPARIRMVLFVLFTLPMFGTYLLLRALLTPFAPFARVRRAAERTMIRGWAKGAARLLCMKVLVEGPVPKPPFFLVSNHTGYVDIVAFLCAVDATFLSKSEVGSWPLLGMLARGVGTLFIDREKRRDLPRVAEMLRGALASGKGIIVFPEGTSSDGRAVLPFKPATFEAAARLGIPVHAACLVHSTKPCDPPASEAVCWWGDAELVPHLSKLASLGGFTTTIRFAPVAVPAADRKALAEQSHALVAGLLGGESKGVANGEAFAILRDALARVLEQAVALIDSIDEETFSAAEPGLALSSVGAHLRHVGDAVERLLERDAAAVDYDARARDVLLEIDPEAARARFERLAATSRALERPSGPLLVNIDSPFGEAPVYSTSSIERELQFAAGHCVHHFALVALRLRLLGVTVPNGFGVAPATLHHLERLRCAR